MSIQDVCVKLRELSAASKDAEAVEVDVLNKAIHNIKAETYEEAAVMIEADEAATAAAA